MFSSTYEVPEVTQIVSMINLKTIQIHETQSSQNKALVISTDFTWVTCACVTFLLKPKDKFKLAKLLLGWIVRLVSKCKIQ